MDSIQEQEKFKELLAAKFGWTTIENNQGMSAVVLTFMEWQTWREASPKTPSILSRDEIATVALPFLCYPLQTSMTMRGQDIIDFGIALVESAIKKQQPTPLFPHADAPLESPYE